VGADPNLAYTRCGTGRPLVLLHPLGSSRRIWDPVIGELARHFEVLAVDLPGFGDSDPIAPGGDASPAALAATVDALLDDLGVDVPHRAGNSLGGWVALELAALRPVASLTLLAPAGLWKRETPQYCRLSLRSTRWLAKHAAAPLSWLVRFRLGRIVVLGQTHGRAWRMDPAAAQLAVRALGTSRGFDAALKATLHDRYRSRGPITAPVTLAFGSRDLVLLRRQSRHVEELPIDTRRVTLAGCGHLPVADDPAAVAATILDTARRSEVSAAEVPTQLMPGLPRSMEAATGATRPATPAGSAHPSPGRSARG
jgi:pimeloyl-ACP methyl ester carboxylesterase